MKIPCVKYSYLILGRNCNLGSSVNPGCMPQVSTERRLLERRENGSLVFITKPSPQMVPIILPACSHTGVLPYDVPANCSEAHFKAPNSATKQFSLIPTLEFKCPAGKQTNKR